MSFPTVIRRFSLNVIAFSLIFPATGQRLLSQELFKSFENEIHALLDSSRKYVVTVSSKFSREIPNDEESSIFSFLKSSTRKQSPYVNIGTGIIYSDSGHVLTRSSIVLGSRKNYVQLADGEKISAEFIGHDAETGFAIIKIDRFNLAAGRLGDSDSVRAGSWSILMGNSLGSFPAAAIGMVNSIRDDGLIQVSADLKPGNNGAPLINTRGEIVGLIAGKVNLNNNYINLNQSFHAMTLAYPSNLVRKIADDIIRHGYVRKGWLGIVGTHDGKKPKIQEIKENSPAMRAGLNKDDVIIKYGDRDVSSITDLVRMVKYTPPGHTVSLEYSRGDEIMQTNIEIGERAMNTGERSAGQNAERVWQYETKKLPFNLMKSNQLLERRVKALELEVENLRKQIKSSR